MRHRQPINTWALVVVLIGLCVWSCQYWRIAAATNRDGLDPTSANLEAALPTAMDFITTKRFLKTAVYAPGDREYYCGCEIQAEGKKWVPSWQSCGYVPRRNAERGHRIEWEHVVPAWAFGHQLQCWQQGGRKHCVATDPVFRAMEGDPHNLVPVIGEINGDRGTFSYGMVAGAAVQSYGSCGSQIDFSTRRFMPPPERRGDIARIYQYFQARYGLRISRQDEALFDSWSRQDPVDAQECRKNQIVAQRTGHDNPMVSAACL